MSVHVPAETEENFEESIREVVFSELIARNEAKVSMNGLF